MAARSVHIMDAPDRVAACRVFSTPFIVRDGALELVGVPRAAGLRARTAARLRAD